MSDRLAPTVGPDTQFFWDGLRDRKLLIQRCTACQALRHPPRPMCPSCNSLDWDTVESSGRGTVHSFVMPQHPQLPLLEYPYIVALVELEEGTRLVSNLCEVAPGDVDRHAGRGLLSRTSTTTALVLHQFRPVRDEQHGISHHDPRLARHQRRRRGHCHSRSPVTATVIVAGAIATRDFMPVHHDRDYAKSRARRTSS